MPRNHRPEVAGNDGSVPPPPRRGLSKTAVTVSVLALVAGAWLMRAGTSTTAPPAPSAADSLTGTGHNDGGAPGVLPRVSASVPPRVAPLPPSLPQRIRIPEIGVDAPLMRLGVDAKDELQVPPDSDNNLAGWYEGGATPGARGSSVIAGHVDTNKGPAVFYAIGSLHKGDTIRVTRADHRTAVFSVYGIEVYEKSAFPTDRVYDSTPTPELRLVTCGGGFSKSTHSYLGNVVVYARLTATK